MGRSLVNATEKDCVEMGSNEFAYILYNLELQVYQKELFEYWRTYSCSKMDNEKYIQHWRGWCLVVYEWYRWIVGHSYIVYAPLFKGCTTVLFEGKPVGTPDAGTFWKIISDYKVKSLFTAPTALAIKKEDPEGKFFSKYDISSFESLFLRRRADPDTIKWAENLLKVPVIDHWWQTETSWAISSNCTGIEMQN